LTSSEPCGIEILKRRSDKVPGSPLRRIAKRIQIAGNGRIAAPAGLTPPAGVAGRVSFIALAVLLAGFTTCSSDNGGTRHDWSKWYRPADNPVFNTTHGNNHDAILFIEPELEYPCHLIVSHTEEAAHLWRTKTFSWNSADWELVSDQYVIGGQYEYDDGINVEGTYYIYEDGWVYSFSGPLEEASGRWERAGSFPFKRCDDIGVFYEDGLFHIFGEYGESFKAGDGTSLSHFTSPTGVGDWQLVSLKAADPNPDGGRKYGVGDPTIALIEGDYYIFSDLETKESPYRVVAWKSHDLNSSFEYLGVAVAPRSKEVDDWDNYRIQDADIGFVPELSRYVMVCNMMDKDGNPGGDFPTLRNYTRVVGFFYSSDTLAQGAGRP
jgi:hypothetical protein